MKNVIREPEPKSLRKHSEDWLVDLLEAIDNFRENNVPISRTIKNRYAKNDVRTALKKMYDGGDGSTLCCYCETNFKATGYSRIEHRMPKAIDKFPDESFNWHNLHLSCEVCNGIKQDQWNMDHPILDATAPDPIENHLSYAIELGAIRIVGLTENGITTIRHTGLNRDGLNQARIKLYLNLQKQLNEYMLINDTNIKFSIRETMTTYFTGEHGSFIKWFLCYWQMI